MLTLFTSKKCFNSTFLLQYNVQLTLRIVHEFLYQTKIRTALQAMVETALEVAPALGQDLADMLRLQENNWFCKLNSLVRNAAKSHLNCRHVTTFIHMICPRYFWPYFFWRVPLKNFLELTARLRRYWRWSTDARRHQIGQGQRQEEVRRSLLLRNARSRSKLWKI